MCLFDEKDLFRLLKDEKLFSAFALLEREKQILFAHILHGQSFASIAAIFKISSQRVHIIYKRSLKKIKRQAIAMIKEYQTILAEKKKSQTSPAWILMGTRCERVFPKVG